MRNAPTVPTFDTSDVATALTLSTVRPARAVDELLADELGLAPDGFDLSDVIELQLVEREHMVAVAKVDIVRVRRAYLADMPRDNRAPALYVLA